MSQYRFRFYTRICIISLIFLAYNVTESVSKQLPEQLPPREVVRIVDPDNGPGTDYTSLQAFAHHERRNLVKRNEIAVALCRSFNGTADKPAQFARRGWVTDRDHYVKVVAADGHRASAVWDERKYRIIETTERNSESIDIEIDNIVIDGIQMLIKGSGESNDVLDAEGGDLFIIKNCYLWMDIAEQTGYGYDPKSPTDVINCIIRGNGSVGLLAKEGAVVNAYNNTFVGWQHAIKSKGAVVKAVNNLCIDIREAPFVTSDGGRFTEDSDYNTSTVAGNALVNAPRSSTQPPWFIGNRLPEEIFVDPQQGNFELKPDAMFIGIGVGPAIDERVPHIDINGQSRSGELTDLGASLAKKN